MKTNESTRPFTLALVLTLGLVGCDRARPAVDASPPLELATYRPSLALGRCNAFEKVAPQPAKSSLGCGLD